MSDDVVKVTYFLPFGGRLMLSRITYSCGKHNADFRVCIFHTQGLCLLLYAHLSFQFFTHWPSGQLILMIPPRKKIDVENAVGVEHLVLDDVQSEVSSSKFCNSTTSPQC